MSHPHNLQREQFAGWGMAADGSRAVHPVSGELVDAKRVQAWFGGYTWTLRSGITTKDAWLALRDWRGYV